MFEQFFKVNLEPPSTYADVSAVLEKLKEKSVRLYKSVFLILSSLIQSTIVCVIPRLFIGILPERIK